MFFRFLEQQSLQRAPLDRRKTHRAIPGGGAHEVIAAALEQLDRFDDHRILDLAGDVEHRLLIIGYHALFGLLGRCPMRGKCAGKNGSAGQQHHFAS
jgi:hypothetical protein